MRRESKVKGAAPHVAAGVGVATLFPLVGPLALLAYPILAGIGKSAIASQMDEVYLEDDIEAARVWEQNSSGERCFRISTTRDVGGIIPLPVTREHTFTKDGYLPRKELKLSDLLREDCFAGLDISAISPEDRKLVSGIRQSDRQWNEGVIAQIKEQALSSEDDFRANYSEYREAKRTQKRQWREFDQQTRAALEAEKKDKEREEIRQAEQRRHEAFLKWIKPWLPK